MSLLREQICAAYIHWIALRYHHRFTQERNSYMRLIIALILPWLTFFTIGKPIAGIICLILQITLIGWLPATIWAVYSLSQYKTDQKIEKLLQQQQQRAL